MNIVDIIKNEFYEIDQKTINLLAIFSQIPKDHIDDQKTMIFNENDFVKIFLNGIEQKFCSLYFEIGMKSNKHKVSVDFGEGANILYYEDFSDKKGYDDVYCTINGVLKNPIKKKEYCIGDKLYKVVYSCPYFKLTENENILFSKSFKAIMFWHKPIVKEKSYSPWIGELGTSINI